MPVPTNFDRIVTPCDFLQEVGFMRDLQKICKGGERDKATNGVPMWRWRALRDAAEKKVDTYVRERLSIGEARYCTEDGVESRYTAIGGGES